ncbi:acylneuraminate cytidylyltransferase family protein [Pseudobutyrivibrio xylanivorans]|uniref:CMP-N-acetylneuraminic acid synthetase n=1 Tax=Pseudobutyrivibrio xylanivorans TaxID=185007 RepID=A0A1G5RX19_PSEXY|nr:CMP-N-acetylneuraminic acid synthetase [Pseudobutyrivibrio xylanivorans]SCZ78662.1 CMP-N-acetylneuraminic acid synthetase [Pseudobutyrivibrio xylanivorans]
MKTTIFMPIKLNNERTPGKNLKKFDDGTALLQVPLMTALEAKKDGDVDRIVVFCSNPDIQEYLPEGVEFVQRPERLDTQAIRCGDIIEAFLEQEESDIYVMYHATSPFITKKTLTDCINAVKSGKYDSAFAAKKLQNFMWFDGKPLNFALDCAPRTQDMKPYYCELSSPYVFTREVFEKYHGRTGENPFICECSEIEAIDIDYPEDFELANAVYMSLIKK